MVFVSYAQNFEDVMLQRALKDVDEGRYIDVGAADPELHSVTAAFYGRGWSGLNIEPNGEFFQRLRDRRLRDVNLPIALGDAAGRATFYRIPGTGLSTCNESVAARQREAGWEVVEETVPIRTLAYVCREHMRGEVHFLKIDVEGAERAVLSGADFSSHRPWIVLVEATEPSGTKATHGEWAELLTGGASYKEVYFDGLNRFYVAEERLADLAHAFAVPPNVHDNFVRASDESIRFMLESYERTAAATERAGRAEERAAAAAQTAAAADARAQQADQRAQDADGRARQAEQQALEADARSQAAEHRAQQEAARRAATEAMAQMASQQAVQAETARAAAVDALAASRAEVRAHAERAAVAEAATAASADALARLQAEHAAATDLVLALRTSASWELTGPARLVGLMARRWRRLSLERRATAHGSIAPAAATADRTALAPPPGAPSTQGTPLPQIQRIGAARDRRGQAIFERLHRAAREG